MVRTTPSSTCTCTPSTPCWTARPGSTTCSPRPRGWGCRPWPPPTTGYVFGAYEFYRKAAAHGVKPIIGVEAYLAPTGSRFDRTRVKWGDSASASRDDVSGGGAFTHLTLLAETTEGMHNLFRMSSLASLEGQFYKPRMDRDLLQRYGKGLIATTGCPSGEVQTRLRLGQYDARRCRRRPTSGTSSARRTTSAS